MRIMLKLSVLTLNTETIYIREKFVAADHICFLCLLYGRYCMPICWKNVIFCFLFSERFPTLVAYIERMKALVWPDWDDCTTRKGTSKATRWRHYLQVISWSFFIEQQWFLIFERDMYLDSIAIWLADFKSPVYAVYYVNFHNSTDITLITNILRNLVKIDTINLNV